MKMTQAYNQLGQCMMQWWKDTSKFGVRKIYWLFKKSLTNCVFLEKLPNLSELPFPLL